MLRVSYNTIDLNKRTSNGYGYAGHNIVQSLRRIGHVVEADNQDCDVQFFFSQPNYMPIFDSNKMNIAYTPWESSTIKRSWVAKFNQADEVWTTSDICADWYLKNGVTRPIHVFEHGISSDWKPIKRMPNRPIKFLHIGEPSPRKGGQMVLDAFRTAFPDRFKATLTIKAYTHNTTRVYETPGRPELVRSILGTPEMFPNIDVLVGDINVSELRALYWDHDVLVYPSWGEGFGFIPLQGLATGMPTICTGAWAPYREFLGPLELNSRPASSPWPDVHPGKMFEPNFEHLVSLMREAAEDYAYLSEYYYTQAHRVRDAYDWSTLTKNAFAHLENK
jgi:glycosyltransferase involved in cell wall biosynthesis